MAGLNRRLLKQFLSIAKLYWVSEARWVAFTLLGVLVVLLLGYTYFSVVLNQELGECTSALAAKDSNRFWRGIRLIVIFLIVAVPVNSFYYFVRDKLAINWRRWLTNRFLNNYFKNRAYYELAANPKIDNPDQRLTEDINSFTQRSLQFLLIAVNGLMQLIAFSAVLWTISHLLVYFLIVYATVGTAMTTLVFGRALTALNFTQIKREADYRFSLVRVRENVESIAFYQGEDREKSYVRERFEKAFTNYNKLIRWQFYLNSFQYVNSYAIYVLPYAILASAVLSGELEVGRVVQAAGAFTAILVALNLIIDNFDSLSKFAAGIDRLNAFAKAIDTRSAQLQATAGKIDYKTGSRMKMEQVTLTTPGGQRTLIKDLTLEIEPGAGLAVSGPSGCGKTSLLRAIAGLWISGSGTIIRPPLSEILFLPQRPYMVLGNLRNQLLYPQIDMDVSDDELRRVLKLVNLQHIVDGAGFLDAELDWPKVLSLGEQQRISFARLLLLKPKFAILDEATSALDPVNEERLYRQLDETDTTLISVTHHPAILKYHQHLLELLGEGKWQLHAIVDDKGENRIADHFVYDRPDEPDSSGSDSRTTKRHAAKRQH